MASLAVKRLLPAAQYLLQLCSLHRNLQHNSQPFYFPGNFPGDFRQAQRNQLNQVSADGASLTRCQPTGPIAQAEQVPAAYPRGKASSEVLGRT
jgi:hypothetical protein